MKNAQMEIYQPGPNGQVPSVLAGSIGKRLLNNNMDPGVLKPWLHPNGQAYVTLMVNGQPKAVPFTNATLREDEWQEMDQAIITAAQERLVGVADLYARNLVHRTAGLGKTVLEYEDVDEFSPAELTMDATTPSKKDRPNYTQKYLPLPIVHKDFSFNIRTMSASRTTGDSVDVTSGQLAAREVAELVESILFNGANAYAYGGGIIRGYTDHPSRNTVTLTTSWSADSGITGALILADVLSMKQASIDAKHYGPYVLYIPTAYETVIDGDFKADSDKTIRQRILEVGNINEIKVADKLTADNVLLVQMSSEVVRIVEGMPLTSVEWEEGGGFASNFKVMTIMVPQIRADQSGNCGVTHLAA